MEKTQTDVAYCYCCGKPKELRPGDSYGDNLIFVTFINGGAWLCRQCGSFMQREKVREYTVAGLNPNLRKFEQAVQSGKLDIGMRVLVTMTDGSTTNMPTKLRPERCAY